MFNLLTWLPGVMFLAFPFHSSDLNTKKNRKLVIMTYNVHHCNPPSKTKTGFIDIEAVSEVIRKQRPDIVALQEIDVNTTRSGKIDEAKQLAKKTGMNYFFGKAIDYDGGDYGVAILSKFPLSDPKVFLLPSDSLPSAERRVLLSVCVILPGGDSVRFGSTHLDVSNAANRMLQLQKITEISSTYKVPFILAGDFNDKTASALINTLDENFTRTCNACAFTIPVENPSKAIDFIAFKPSGAFSVEKHYVVDEKYASDHLPVVSILKY